MELDSYAGTDPLGMFPLFLRGQLMFWPLVVGLVSRRLLVCDIASVFAGVDNVIAIPKGLPYTSVENYRQTSITPIMSKVF